MLSIFFGKTKTNLWSISTRRTYLIHIGDTIETISLEYQNLKGNRKR